MTSVAEAVTGNSSLGAALASGLTSISENATITFTKYVRRTLVLDGFVFWLKGESQDVQGSLHYSTNRDQREDETISVNRVLFTTTTPITALNEQNPQTLWIGSFDGMRFAFGERGSYFKQSGLYHYAGAALYSALASQLVDSLYDLGPDHLIVSNSLPVWLALSQYSPIWLQPANPEIQLYPSFLAPGNLIPPYGTVHIEPAQTAAIAMAPTLTKNVSHYQLAQDHVRITLYGYDNDAALDFIDLVNQYSIDQDVIGIMGAISIVKDEKRPQSEISAIAQKKTIEFDVSYYQTRINDLVRQLITSSPVTFTVAPLAA